MKSVLAAALRKAGLSTRAGDIGAAMRTIQAALGRDGAAPPVEVAPGTSRRPGSTDRSSPATGSSRRMRRPLRDVLAAIRDIRVRTAGNGLPSLSLPGMNFDGMGLPGMNLPGMNLPGVGLPGMNLPGMARSTPPPIPAGARFETRTFATAAGARDYKLYVPASAAAAPRGLVVMLHGCRQDPDDFASGTQMNAVAESHGLLVAYPGQPHSANVSSCWNWFNPGDQRRSAGEPAIIAGITGEVMREFQVSRDAVFVAGLSAGGAMAAIMAETYPDLFAAAGIHSGLAYGVADDVVSAFAAMRGDVGMRPSGSQISNAPRVRTIVFQGTADAIVHPVNADRIFAGATPEDAGGRRQQDRVRVSDGSTATRTTVTDAAGCAIAEYWAIDGAGHAWSGGSSSGSFADERGPDASREMMRFFLTPAGAGAGTAVTAGRSLGEFGSRPSSH